MDQDRRSIESRDRRARPRGGRRRSDAGKPWYMRRRLWLAAASLVYVAWRRMRNLTHRSERGRSSGLAA